jgi:predicted DNA-binding transcriptional regulator YafY
MNDFSRIIFQAFRIGTDSVGFGPHENYSQYKETVERLTRAIDRKRTIEVKLVFDRATAAWAKDREWHPSQRLEPMKGGILKMFLSVADTSELIGWILSFGAGVRVAEPAALRDNVRAEAKKIFDQG